MFCYQENTHFSQALPCNREVFWELVRKQSTAWRIDARRAIIVAVEASQKEGTAAIQTWLDNSDFQKLCLKKQGLKTESARKAWQEKSNAEKLLTYAQDLKENLPAFIFCCREFDAMPTASGKPFSHRRLAECHLNGLVMLDIDHVENPMQIWWQLRGMDELMARVALVHITSSGQGLRIIFTADINEGNLADNQIVMAEALGEKADDSCIDATRNSFAPKEEDILYINEDLLFDYYDENFDKRFTDDYRKKRTQPLHHQFSADDGAADSDNAQAAAVADGPAVGGAGKDGQVDAASVSPVGNGQCSMVNVQWRNYDIQRIIDARYAEKLPCRDDSNRHKESLKLATDLLIMLDGDKKLVQQIVEEQPWVKEIIQERDENVGQTVDSAVACVAEKEKKTANPYPSKAMMAAIKAVTGMEYREIAGEAPSQEERAYNFIDAKLDKWGEEIEALWDDFPLLKDVCSGLKRSQYPAAMFVAGGTLMTDMTRCWYRFYHRPQQERRLNCSLFIIGHPASNKSMADDIYEILSDPIAKADLAGKLALNRYKQDTKKKAANKEGKDKPQALIRIHPARTSNGQLIQDMLNAHENIGGRDVQLHMLTFDTELDNATTLQSGGSWINKMSMELKAFHNEKDGQMYQNSDSPVDEFNVTWNYIYTGTPIALKRKVNERNFGSGLSTRLAVIPVPKTNFQMMEYEDEERIDWDRINRMKEWAYKLDARAGQLPVKPLVRHLWEWTKNRMEDCREDNSDANELMLKRVAYHALNYSVPFIDMRHFGDLHQDGKYWTGSYETDETDWKLCELIARIQYATQQHFFGTLAEKYFDDMNSDVQITGRRHQQRSVDGYNRLPEVFTKEDVMKSFGYNTESAVNKKIYRLTLSSLVEPVEEGENKGKFRKLSNTIY